MKQYKLIFLDADDTLFDFKRAEAFALERSLAERGVAMTEGLLRSYVAINEGLWRGLERGEIDQLRLRSERFRLLFREQGLGLDPAAFGEEYLGWLGKASFLLPESEEVCAYLAGKYRLALLTNGIKEVQVARLAASPLRAYIERIVVSEEAGSSKPDPAIFEYACGLLGYREKGGILMVGDALASDIKGAANFGIDSCWLNPAGAPNDSGIVPAYEIRNLAELKGIL